MEKLIQKINALGYLVSISASTSGKFKWAAQALQGKAGGPKYTKAIGFADTPRAALKACLAKLEDVEEYEDLIGSKKK